MLEMSMGERESGSTFVDIECSGWVRRFDALMQGKPVTATTLGQTVEWSVPENAVEPLNMLEHWAWQKSIQLDRDREKMTFVQLRSQVMLMNQTQPARADVLREQLLSNESKKISLVRRLSSPNRDWQRQERDASGPASPAYVPAQIAQRQYEQGRNVCAVCVDSVLYGGLLSDLQVVSAVAEGQQAVISLDLIINAYNIFQHRLHGSDGIVLSAAIFPPKDLLYVLKAARALKIFTIVEVNSEAQMDDVLDMSRAIGGLIDAVLAVDRDLESLQPRPWEQTRRLFSSSSCRREKPSGVLYMVEVAGEEEVDALFSDGPDGDAAIGRLIDTVLVPAL
ncbi:Indole-3-glycerol phosphate synthase [Porphyridium purpureum]|uniref:indole-3-glycerol-phosphate synthase n=1 Tax=Porphyridium purpureum TaxID=35688 RepID=A0A5J4Z639_PORPP|nr:Indole-3-glycerol phosphate synthase [Porphyridium purpureum]|eukprot:POR6247..scf295_1